MRKPDGSLNNLIIHKLKNKFGTKAVPTAELEITGAPAILVGEVNAGVKAISTILNITRVHNAVHMVRRFFQYVVSVLPLKETITQTGCWYEAGNCNLPRLCTQTQSIWRSFVKQTVAFDNSGRHGM